MYKHIHVHAYLYTHVHLHTHEHPHIGKVGDAFLLKREYNKLDICIYKRKT